MLLTGSCSDALEHFLPEGLSGDGTDHIARVLLFLDIAGPFKEDVLEFRNVNVASFAVL